MIIVSSIALQKTKVLMANAKNIVLIQNAGLVKY